MPAGAENCPSSGHHLPALVITELELMTLLAQLRLFGELTCDQHDAFCRTLSVHCVAQQSGAYHHHPLCLALCRSITRLAEMIDWRTYYAVEEYVSLELAQRGMPHAVDAEKHPANLRNFV